MYENSPNFQVLWNVAQNPTISSSYEVGSGKFTDLLRKGDSEALNSLWDKHCTVSNPDLLPYTGKVVGFPAGALKLSVQSVNQALRKCLFTDPTEKTYSLVYRDTHTRRKKRKANMMSREDREILYKEMGVKEFPPSDSELSTDSGEELGESFLSGVEMSDDVAEKISTGMQDLHVETS